MKKSFAIILLSIFVGTIMRATPIGKWNIYYAYHGITEVQWAGDRVFVLSSKGLYAYRPGDKTVQTYDKMNFLNDCGMAHIAYVPQAKKLLIVYENQNMDILDMTDKVSNLSGYYRQSMSEDKTVNSVNVEGKFAYLSTAFGILKVNVEAEEISETYNLGFPVDYSYIQGGYIHAESKTMGRYSAPLTANLLERKNWVRTGEYGGLVKDLTTVTDESTKTTWMEASNGGLKAVQRQTDGTSVVVVDGVKPDGPRYNYFGFLRFSDGILYSVGGGYNAVAEMNYPAAVQIFDLQDWDLCEEDIENRIGHGYRDMISMAVDPTDKTHLAVVGKSGVYEFKDKKFTAHYNFNNSPLLSVLSGNPNYTIVPGVTFDNSGTLWCFNSRVTDVSLLKKPKGGSFEKVNHQLFFNSDKKSLYFIRDMKFDSRGLLWMVNDHWDVPSFYVCDPKTGAVNGYRSFYDEDGKSISPNYVRCVAEDKRGDMWIGTNVGPVVLTAEAIGQGSSALMKRVKVPRNDGTNFADYLLDGVDISCMAVDGGGRKWFGTNGSGVYLISEDNNTQLHHFLVSNSNLLSDKINSIAINGATGEVFIATDKGLCSFMSDATTPSEEMSKDEVYAYPNPVTPDFTGVVTIVGLSYNADVKIVTANGKLVAQGKSNGGTFTWDRTDLDGKPVAGGMYMVLAATEEGNKGTVCKIGVIR